MNLKKTFGFRKDKAEEGVWVDIGDGGFIKVGKIGTIKYLKAVERATRKYRAKIRANRNLTPEEAIEVAIEADAEGLLFDWRGFTDDENNPIPCTHENKIEFLRNYPDFRALVETHANDIELFQDDLEADAKN